MVSYGPDYVEFTKSDGTRGRQHLPRIDYLASDIRAAGTAWSQAGQSITFSFDGVTQTVFFGKDWRWRMDRTWDAGENIIEPSLGLKRLFMLVSGQSNMSGRGLISNLPQAFLDLMAGPAGKNPSLSVSDVVWPNVHPYREYSDGPGVDQQVGPALMLLARIMANTTKYDRATIICTAVGNRRVLQMFDAATGLGEYITKRDDPEVQRGTSIANPPGFPKTEDDYIQYLDIGEADASNGTSGADYTQHIFGLGGKINADVGFSTQIMTILSALSPTAKNGIDQGQWNAVRTAQLAFNQFNNDTPPFYAIARTDAQMKVGDLIHASSPGNWEHTGLIYDWIVSQPAVRTNLGLPAP